MVCLRNDRVTEQHVQTFVRLALDCVHRSYPNVRVHCLPGDTLDADRKLPRELTPVFFGCYDWHSAVHNHWLLVRACRLFPGGGFVPEARAAMGESFQPEKFVTELDTLHQRHTPVNSYGLAWLLQLGAELTAWDDLDGKVWATRFEPFIQETASQMETWITLLTYPIRDGIHAQSAFGFGLALDWARRAGAGKLAALIEERSRDHFLADGAWNLEFEPSAVDFLSPGLGEADLLRRMLEPTEFAAWLERFLPQIGAAKDDRIDWLIPAVSPDRSSGPFAHLDGLNLSRAWMLEGIASGLPEDDPRMPTLLATADRHRKVGLAAVTGEHYAGAHWLGTFALYLVTGAGLYGPEIP